VKEVVSIEESLEKLYETIKTSAPPWLKKALHGKSEGLG
jgi:nitrogen fixation protein NifX